MALQINSHIDTPVALSAKAPGNGDGTPSTVSSAPASTRGLGAPVDTVKLSLSAHIHLLKSQGQNAKAIAANLGVPASTVAAYFSASAASSSGQTAAPARVTDTDADVSAAKASKTATPAAQPAATPVPTK